MPLILGAKVMAIGDSITYGFGAAQVVAEGAWRYYFADQFSAYVRSNIVWTGDNPALGYSKAGFRMVGASGQKISDINTSYDLANQLAKWRPDVICIHLGTNDITNGVAVATSVTNMGTLLDTIRTQLPNAIVLISTLGPHLIGSTKTTMDTWNTQMETARAARSDAAYIRMSDSSAAMTANPSWATDYMYDNTHFNAAGEAIIASTFITTLQSFTTIMPRTGAQRRLSIKPHANSLSYAASTATTLGSGVTLNSAQPWTVAFWVELSARVSTQVNGILTCITDQATPFGFCITKAAAYFGLEWGSSANFDRFRATPAFNGDAYSAGWHHFVIVFDGVDRTADTSYDLYVDGVSYTVTNNAGLAGATNANRIGFAFGNFGTFKMAELIIWNGGSVMTAQQAQDLYFANILPSGPTLTRRYEHTDGSGTTLTDSTGNQNGTIGTATWNTDIPTKARATAIARTTAATRTVAS